MTIITDPPNDGKIYLRRNNVWVVAGGTTYGTHFVRAELTATTQWVARTTWGTANLTNPTGPGATMLDIVTHRFTAAEAGIWFMGGTMHVDRATDRGFTNHSLARVVRTNGTDEYFGEVYAGGYTVNYNINWMGWLDKDEEIYIQAYLANDDFYIRGSSAGSRTAVGLFMVAS